MWKCGSLESTVCYEFIYLNRSSTGMMSKIPKKTRTQKYIMGVIVACDFCAKPSVTVVFTRKQWIFLLLCYLLCVSCELSTYYFRLLESLLK